MREALEGRIASQVAAQRGVFSRAQILALGGSRSLIERRLHSGAWVRHHPGVYGLAGVPSSWRQEVWAARLAIGPSGTVTHETALRLHGLSDDLVPRYPLTFTVPHGGHVRVKGTVVHQIDDLQRSHREMVGGLPVSTAARAVVEVAATVGRRRLGDIIDELLVSHRTSHDGIAACLADVARPRKRRVRLLGAVLDERGDGYVAPESELERSLFSALANGGLPAPARQVPLPGREPAQGLVDAAYPDVRLILEADGRRWHTRLRDLKRDHERDAEAARVGWQTLRFVYEQIIGHPDEVVAVVVDVLDARLRSRRRPRPHIASAPPRRSRL